jgi:hypothetical protein
MTLQHFGSNYSFHIIKKTFIIPIARLTDLENKKNRYSFQSLTSHQIIFLLTFPFE